MSPSRAGRPSDPPFDGMWWTYVPMRFDDFCVVLIMQETPEGHRTFNDCSRVFPDGRIEQLGWPLVQVHYASGTRSATGATIRCTRPDGVEVLLEVEARLPTPLHLGGGYGGDGDWSHGSWKGEGFVERLSYDVTDPRERRQAHVRRRRLRRAQHLPRGGPHQRGLGPFRARCDRPPRPQRFLRLVRPRALSGVHPLAATQQPATRSPG